MLGGPGKKPSLSLDYHFQYIEDNTDLIIELLYGLLWDNIYEALWTLESIIQMLSVIIMRWHSSSSFSFNMVVISKVKHSSLITSISFWHCLELVFQKLNLLLFQMLWFGGQLQLFSPSLGNIAHSAWADKWLVIKDAGRKMPSNAEEFTKQLCTVWERHWKFIIGTPGDTIE